MDKIVDKLANLAEKNSLIDPELYDLYKVKRGLRNSNGTGVLVGLTKVGSVVGYDLIDDKKVAREGKLYYRGIDVESIVKGFQDDKRMGFEETSYLLLFGELPNKQELLEFNELLAQMRCLPKHFTENMILKIPSSNIMNKLQRSVLVLYSHDENPEDLSINNVLSQSLNLIAKFPTIISYGYQAKSHYFYDNSLFIHSPRKDLSTAENILHMIRPDSRYTKTEAEILDLSLVLHAEHGGGNNSAFATHVVSSSGTDTYSAISTAVGSLKGPKHGGANLKVQEMIDSIKKNVPNWTNKTDLTDYLVKILKKDAFDKTGLIYGMGHAVYTLSDPRAVLLKNKAKELAKEKNKLEEYELYTNIEEISKEIYRRLKGKDAVISANVDMYSGFVYELLNIPKDLYTALFATSRISGWCAHRIEQIISDKKIMRPAYKSIDENIEYINIASR